jgi:ABC-type sugar transport system ATPase subunit
VNEQELVRRMVGRELADLYGSRAAPMGNECLRVESAGREGAFSGISFTLRRGEILGLAGLAGAGRTEFARGLFGAEPFDAGRTYLDGQPVRIRSPHDAIRNHLAYLTEDRRRDGLFLDMTVRDNCAASSLSCFATSRGLMDEQAMTDFAEYQRVQFDIATPSTRQRVGNLSGGNQQKVLLAMWMGVKPRVLIVDEPTRGVDVGARSDIYHRLRELAATGVGILLISSDLPELLGLSDRILVMRGGRLAGEFARDQATEEGIIACASGIGAPSSNRTGDSSGWN